MHFFLSFFVSSLSSNLQSQAPAREIIDPIVERIARNAQLCADLRVTGPIGLPIQRRKYTINKSPFVDKKSREQFEIQSHTRLIVIEGIFSANYIISLLALLYWLINLKSFQVTQQLLLGTWNTLKQKRHKMALRWQCSRRPFSTRRISSAVTL